MELKDLEQHAVNALHRAVPVETLRACIGGSGIPAAQVEAAIRSVEPDDEVVLQIVLQAQRHLARTPADASFWEWRSQQEVRHTTILDLARAKVAAHLLRHVRRYEQALGLALPHGAVVSGEGLALLGVFLREYLCCGFHSAGHVSAGYAFIQLAWESLDPVWHALDELTAASLVQRRGSQAASYALTYPVRHLLVTSFDLCQAWYEARPLFRAWQGEEIERVQLAVGLSPARGEHTE